DAERWVDEDPVAEEALDVVALVRRAVAEDVHVVLAHRAHDRRRGHSAPEGRRVEVLLAAAREVKGAALDRDETLSDERLSLIDEPRGGGAVLERDRRDQRAVLLVGLREVGRVAVDLDALLVHPGDRGAGVEPARKGEAHAGTGGGEASVDAAHGAP